MLKLRCRVWLCLLAGLWSPAAVSSAAAPVLEIADLKHRLLRAPVEFRVGGGRDGEDSGGDRSEVSGAEESPDSVRGLPFSALNADQVNRGVSDEAYWLRVRLRNSAAEERTWVLHHETSYLDHMVVYAADNGGPMRRTALSDRRPFEQRPLIYRKLAYQHTTPARGHTDLYVRLQHDTADSITLNLHLWESAAFMEAAQREYLLLGGYYGVLSIFIVIALMCAVFLRQLLYLHYALFLAFSILLWGSLNGLTFQYLWPESPAVFNSGFHVWFLLVTIFALQFSRAFLRIRELFPRLGHAITVAQAIMCVGIGLRLAGWYHPVLVLSYAGLGLLTLLPVLGWMAWHKGLHYARWYALAWLLYALGLGMSVLSAFTSLFSWGMEPLLYTQLGSLVEALFLLLALGDRLMGWERDRKQALKIAHHDALTGLGNRRRLTQAYREFLERFERDREPVFLLLIDLDGFKQINDTCGHDAGDQVLRDVARLLERHTRSSDVCIRFGGEEFAILLQAPGVDWARGVAERIRAEFAAAPTVYCDREIPHTLSAGLTLVLGEGVWVSAKEMIVQADAALYQAKAGGKDCVTVFPEPGEQSAEPGRPGAGTVSVRSGQ